MTICMYCDRRVRVRDGRYGTHACPLSGQRVPVAGHSAADYERRAWTVVDLAGQVQDEDPALVWTYLTATPADELQRLLMIALAGMPLDRSIDQTFGWVVALPVARRVS